jgi:hypothetical protein
MQLALAVLAVRCCARALHGRTIQVVETTASVLDEGSRPLEAVALGELHEVLLRLSLYRSEALVQAVLELLMLHCSAQANLVEDLLAVRYVDGDDERHHRTLCGDVIDLTTLTESLAMWQWIAGVGEGPLRKRKAANPSDPLCDTAGVQALKLVRKLGVQLQDAEAGAAERLRQLQDSMRDLGLAPTCMRLLGRLHEVLQQAEPGGADPQRSQSNVCRQTALACSIEHACLWLLAWYLRDSPENQRQLFPHCEFFLDHMSAPNACPAYATVLAEMVRCNPSLLQMLPGGFLHTVVDGLHPATAQGRPEVLQLLAAITKEDYSTYIEAHQLDLLQRITRPGAALGELLSSDSSGADGHAVWRELSRSHGPELPTAGPPPPPLPAAAGAAAKPGEGGTGCQVAAAAAARAEAAAAVAGVSGGEQLRMPGQLGALAHLPTALQYRISELHLLSACCGGDILVTKVLCQQMYGLDHVLGALVDPELLVEVKLAVGGFLMNAYLESRARVPDLGGMLPMWKFVVGFAAEAARFAGASAAEAKGAAGRAHALYVLQVLVPCTVLFFDEHFNPAEVPVEVLKALWGEEAAARAAADQTSEKMAAMAVVEMLYDLRNAFSQCADRVESEARLADNSAALQSAVAAVEKRTGKAMEEAEAWGAPSTWVALEAIKAGPPTTRPSLSRASSGQMSFSLDRPRSRSSESGRTLLRSRRPSLRSQPRRSFSPWAQELRSLLSNRRIRVLSDKRACALANFIYEQPTKDKPKSKDTVLCRDYVISKLVRHVEGLVVADDRFTRRLDAKHVETTAWLLRLLRRMIEHGWGCTVTELEAKHPDAAKCRKAMEAQDLLNDCGVTALCTDLIAMGMHEDVRNEAVLLLWALLAREGGNQKAQRTFHSHLSKGGSAFFFLQVKRAVDGLVHWHAHERRVMEEHGGMVGGNEEDDGVGGAGVSGSGGGGGGDGSGAGSGVRGADAGDASGGNGGSGGGDGHGPVVPLDLRLVEALRLACEGHFLLNQNLLREQPSNGADSTSILNATVTTLSSVLYPSWGKLILDRQVRRARPPYPLSDSVRRILSCVCLGLGVNLTA